MHGPQRSLWIGHCSTRSTSWCDLASPREPPCSSSAVMATAWRSGSLEHKHGFGGKFPRCAVVGAAALILFVEGRSILGLFSCRGLTSSLPRRRDSLLPYNQTINDIVTRCVVCVKFSKSEVGMIKSQIDRTEYFRMCFKLVQRRER
jgi:hypothetical protein